MTVMQMMYKKLFEFVISQGWEIEVIAEDSLPDDEYFQINDFTGEKVVEFNKILNTLVKENERVCNFDRDGDVHVYKKLLTLNVPNREVMTVFNF